MNAKELLVTMGCKDFPAGTKKGNHFLLKLNGVDVGTWKEGQPNLVVTPLAGDNTISYQPFDVDGVAIDVELSNVAVADDTSPVILNLIQSVAFGEVPPAV